QSIKKLDAIHIENAWKKALERRIDDPEGAITSARTLIESVCKYILDEAKITYDDRQDLQKLYKQTAEYLNLAPSQHTEDIFKQILGGCTATIEGLGALRNRLSDAHGKGKIGVNPKPRHAQLAVNLSGALAIYLLETWEHKQNPQK
ncbi:abortive infection family protein, partial [Neisseria sp. P0022.S010]